MCVLPKCRSIPVPGSELDCLSFGHGREAVVILPGLSTAEVRKAGPVLSLMYRLFTKDFTVYIMDKRRHVPQGCTVSMLAEDCAAAMDALGIKKAHVLGVSLGGMIAQELAIKRPELVRSLVLALTASRCNPAIENSVGRWLGCVEKGDYSAFGRDMMESMYSEAYLEKYRFLLPLVGLLSRPKDVGRFVNLAKACLSCKSYERLCEISCPTLVIGAVEDRVVSAEASAEIAERLGCKLHIYEKLGHAAYDEADNFNDIVLAFFRKHKTEQFG